MMRLFVTIIILVAVAVGVFALVLHRDQLVTLIIFRDFLRSTDAFAIGMGWIRTKVLVRLG